MECFTGLRQRCRHKSTVFVMEIRWIIVFKVQDQWQSIGRAFIVVRRNKRQMTTCAWNYIRPSSVALAVTADFNDSEMFYAADRGSCSGRKCSCVHSLWHNRRRPFGGHRKRAEGKTASAFLPGLRWRCLIETCNVKILSSDPRQSLNSPGSRFVFHKVRINLFFQGASNKTIGSHNNITKSLCCVEFIHPKGRFKGPAWAIFAAVRDARVGQLQSWHRRTHKYWRLHIQQLFTNTMEQYYPIVRKPIYRRRGKNKLRNVARLMAYQCHQSDGAAAARGRTALASHQAGHRAGSCSVNTPRNTNRSLPP